MQNYVLITELRIEIISIVIYY